MATPNPFTDPEVVCFFGFLNSQTKKLRAAVLDILAGPETNQHLDETQYYLLNKMVKELGFLGKWQPLVGIVKAYLKKFPQSK